MKICKITAALCLLFGLPLIAQVQLGRNVQVGAGSGSGATLPTNAITYGTSSTTSRAATATDITNLVQSSTGCTTSGNFWEPASGTCIAVSGGGGISGQTVTCAVKAASATTSTSSLPICDDGTTLTITHPTTFNDGSGKAAFFGLKQGTAQSTVTGEIGFTAPTSVTAYNMLWPGAQWTGCLSDDGSGNLSGVSCGGGGSLPTATAPGQIISSTAAGTTYAVQPQIFYSQSGDTIASIETECSSACTYVVTAPQTITLAANHALSANISVRFEAGGQWTVNGSGFTLSGLQVDAASALTQHFVTGTGSYSFAGTVSLAPLEWFGGVGDGVMTSGGSGTDNAPAFAQCINALTAGQCVLQPKTYIVHSAISITKDSVGIKGMQQGYLNTSITPASPASIIASTSASADIIDLSGTNPSLPLLWNKIDNVSLHRTVLPTGTARGLSLNFTCGVIVDYVQSNDSISPFYFHSAPSCGSGGVFHTQASWGYSVVPISSYTTGSFIGYDVDSEDGFAENSLYIAYGGFGLPSPTPGATAYGMKVHGESINDLNVFQFSGVNAQYGVYILYDGTGNEGTGGDLHFAQSTFDTSVGTAIYVTGDPFSAGVDGINFDGGLISSLNEAIHVDTTSAPVVIDNAQIFTAASTSLGTVLLNSSSNVTLSGNVVLGGSGSSTPPYFLKLNNSTDNVVTSNQFIGKQFFSPASLVTFTGTSTGNQLIGNMYSGYATTAITLNSTSQANSIGPEQVDGSHITTAYSGFTTQNTAFPNTITCGGGSCGGGGYPQVSSEIVGSGGASAAGIQILGAGGGGLPTYLTSLIGQQTALTNNVHYNGSAWVYDANGGAAGFRFPNAATSIGVFQLDTCPIGTAGGTVAMDTTCVAEWAKNIAAGNQTWLNPQAADPTFPTNAALVLNPSANWWVDFSGNQRQASGTVAGWNGDTGLSRDSAGVVDVGNGTAGDKSGVLNALQVNSYQAGTGTGFGLHAQSAATSGANQAAGNLAFYGNYWNGTASTSDIWTFAPTLGTGTNPISTLFLTHTGTPGVAAVGLPMTAAVLYSAAGTALPACASALNGYEAVVTDATTPTYMGAYTSGGLITAKVICSYNGTAYSWLTH